MNKVVSFLVNVSRRERLIYKWTREPIFDNSLISKPATREEREISNKLEKAWGNKMIKSNGNNQWTTKLGEEIVKRTLIKKGINVYKPQIKQGFKPDLETDKYIYEVKTRNWSTKGTAGEKVFGCPYKYSEIPVIYGKPLRIVCVAYQEYEMTHSKSRVFGKVNSLQEKVLEIYKLNNIEYIKFTDMVKSKSLEW